jgi:hypothetical protein
MNLIQKLIEKWQKPEDRVNLVYELVCEAKDKLSDRPMSNLNKGRKLLRRSYGLATGTEYAPKLEEALSCLRNAANKYDNSWKRLKDYSYTICYRSGNDICSGDCQVYAALDHLSGIKDSIAMKRKGDGK